MMFRGKSLTPTPEQFAKVGQILTDWAILDNLVQVILSRLAMGTDYVTGALTDHLQFEYRLRALQALVEVHRGQMGCKIVSEELCQDIDDLRSALNKHRQLRNRLAHWTVFRSHDDEIAVARFATRPAFEVESAKARHLRWDALKAAKKPPHKKKSEREDFALYSTDDLERHLKAVEDMAMQAEKIHNALPAQPSPFARKSP